MEAGVAATAAGSAATEVAVAATDSAMVVARWCTGGAGGGDGGGRGEEVAPRWAHWRWWHSGGAPGEGGWRLRRRRRQRRRLVGDLHDKIWTVRVHAGARLLEACVELLFVGNPSSRMLCEMPASSTPP